MSKGIEECTPLCESFMCTQSRGTLKFRTQGGKKVAWCNAFDDLCDGAWCQYSKCEIKKMIDGGKCRGRESPKVTEQIRTPEYVEDPSAIPEKFAKKLRSKLGS